MKVFVDANVLFSAAWSPAGRIAVALANPEIVGVEWWTSDYAILETQANLARKRPAALANLRLVLAHCNVIPWSADEPCPVPSLRDKDRPILAAAIVCGAAVLVTGDRRDFGPHYRQPEKTGGVSIVSPEELFE